MSIFQIVPQIIETLCLNGSVNFFVEVLFERFDTLLLDDFDDVEGNVIGLELCVGLVGNPISWQAGKQQTVALSSTEAEYQGVSTGACESIWVNMLLEEMIGNKLLVNFFCDNQAAIAIIRSNNYSERTKHIDVKHHFIKQLVRNGSINLQWISTKDQLADVLTKTLNRATHVDLTHRILAH